MPPLVEGLTIVSDVALPRRMTPLVLLNVAEITPGAFRAPPTLLSVPAPETRAPLRLSDPTFVSVVPLASCRDSPTARFRRRRWSSRPCWTMSDCRQ